MKIPRAQARGIFVLILVVGLLAGIPAANYAIPKVIKRFTPKVVATGLSQAPSAEQQYQKELRDALKTTKIEPGIQSRLASVTNRTEIYRDGCHSNQKNPVPSLPCDFGDKRALDEMWLVGDSHAAQWFTPLNHLAKNHNVKLVVRTMSSCPFISGIPVLDEKNSNYWQCKAHNSWLLRSIEANKPRYIVVSGYFGIEVKNIDATITGLKLLGGSGAQVFVISDTPKPKGFAPDCLSSNPGAVTNCFASRTANQANQIRSKLENIVSQNDYTWIDPSIWLCAGQECPPIIAGRLIYADNTHISTEAQHYLIGRIEAAIGPNLSR